MSKILRGLRGATTAAANTGQAILDATAELLRGLQEANGFQPEDVESAIFTSSPDLTAEYPARADRKSTRLNSSHVRISYAVFCLKKNNKARRSRIASRSVSHWFAQIRPRC